MDGRKLKNKKKKSKKKSLKKNTQNGQGEMKKNITMKRDIQIL
jgi:hypothetical protein